MNDNLQNIWIFGSGHTLVIVVVLQIVDLALTLLHSLQEREGRLWRYFGAIAGVKVPDGFGQIVFFGGLTISLWVVGLLGIAGTVLWQLPGVRETRTYAVMEEVKNTTRLPLSR